MEPRPEDEEPLEPAELEPPEPEEAEEPLATHSDARSDNVADSPPLTLGVEHHVRNGYLSNRRYLRSVPSG